MNTYSAEKYEYLFTEPYEVDDPIGRLHHDNVFRYRVKTIKSGDVCECEIFPIWNTRAEARTARTQMTRDAQRNLNRKNSEKRCRRLADANFTADDLHVTLTYGDSVPLPDEKQARRDIRNYLRRCRTDAENHGRELKYIYVIEWSDGDGRRVRVHHHVLLSGVDRETAENLWEHPRTNAARLQPEGGTLTGLVKYILKQPQSGKGKKRWQGSQNLKKPTVTVADTKLSKRQAERLAEDMDNAAPLIIGGQYPEYSLDEVDVKRSDFVAGAYIYAKMHKQKPPPQKRQSEKRRM
jgi:hypothetical protein